MAKWLIIVGAALVALGLILTYAPWLINWFGKLPGDIRYEISRTKVFIPVTSMIIVSIIISIIVNWLRK